NEELNRRIEETAQTLFKHWFIDFEFPISKEYAEAIGKPELEGKPYKFSGGELVYEEELDREIPLKWELISLERFMNFGNGKKKPASKSGPFPLYGGNGVISFIP